MSELIQGKMLKGTAKAILLEIDGEEVWIPKTQIDCKKGFKATLAISDWCAWTKGLISDNEYDKRKNEYDNKQQVQSGQSDLPLPKQTNLPF